MKRVYLPVLLALAFLVSGCPEAAYRMNEMAGFNCRPDVVQTYGSCIATK